MVDVRLGFKSGRMRACLQASGRRVTSQLAFCPSLSLLQYFLVHDEQCHIASARGSDRSSLVDRAM